MTTSFARHSSIEPLEARIAPALLVNGANLLGGGSPTIGETSLGGDSVTLVKVISGQAIVWFQDGQISSISIGNNTNLEIAGDIHGGIVGNLRADGRLSDSDNDASNGEDGAVLLANSLVGLKTTKLSNQVGDVPLVVTGGSVSNLSINGTLGGVYAGDGAFNAESTLPIGGTVVVPVFFDFNPVELNEQTFFALTLEKSKLSQPGEQSIGLQPGASIKNVTVATAKQTQFIAGSGDPDRVANANAGSAGGSIEGIVISSALIDGLAGGSTPSYELIAGDGEAGKTGGAGGSIVNIQEKASNGTVNIQAGNGGKGNAGNGGAGGGVRGLDMQSDGTVYVVRSGDGGVGVSGGAGGSAGNNNFANRTPTNSILIAADFLGRDGLDDLLVVDSSTGSMVLSRNVESGSDFPKVVQYINDDNEDVVTITTLGDTPVDGFATDWDLDGDQDVVIAYKNSSDLGIFLNDGNGKFYTEVDDERVIDGFNVDLGFSPSAATTARLGEAVTSFAFLSTEAGKSTAYYAFKTDEKAMEVYGTGTPLKRLGTDIVATEGTDGGTHIFVGTQDGSLLELTLLDDADGPAFQINSTGQVIAGGVANLDVSSDGTHLLALSTSAKKVSVFEVGEAGALASQGAPELAGTGRALVARFVPNAQGDDSIAVLSGLTAGSRLDLFAPAEADQDPATPDAAFTLTKTLTTQPSLKTFVVVEGNVAPGYAGAGGSLSQFYFSQSLSDLDKYDLPFVGKKVSITAGSGGNALDAGSTIGKAGAGGGINGLNAEASEIRLLSGDGGDSLNGAAGAGGSVSNPTTFVTSGGGSVAPVLIADDVLAITVGHGGTPLGVGSKSASGGNGGSLLGVELTLTSGEITLLTGDGGDAKGGSGGNGGDLNNVIVKALDGSLTITTGLGGNAPTGKVKGGNGGAVQNLNFSLELNEEIEKLEKAYFVNVTTGVGGSAAQGTGGSGGGVTTTTLKLDGSDRTYDDPRKTPPLLDSHRDSTVAISFTTGAGGVGAVGGHGGSIAGFTSNSVQDQEVPNEGILTNFVVMKLTAGAGGAATAGQGGNGGTVGFGSAGVSGVTSFDPDAVTLASNPQRVPLLVTAGDGGAGSTKGGAGGGILNLLAKNAPFVNGNPITNTQLTSAVITTGAGGAGGTLDGGKGGDISGATLGVESDYDPVNDRFVGGVLHVFSGNGGAGGAGGKGGNAGLITKSTFGAVNVGVLFADSDPLPAAWPDANLSPNTGVALVGGMGGAGGKGGGTGGTLSSLQINTPQVEAGYSAVLFAGAGGAGLGAGAVGGTGGGILSIAQSKDVNSAINIIEAGAGGVSLQGKGGGGGAINGVKTVGFIGRPSFTTRDEFGEVNAQGRLGAFDENGVAQGLFSGRGGAGQSAGAAGAISNIAARQIAAMSAAVDSNGLFGVASKITQVQADVIGFDLDLDNVFDTTGAEGALPNSLQPIDGFILAAAMQKVTVTRPLFTFTVA